MINGDFTNKLDGGLVHRGIYKIGEHFVSGMKESDCLVVFPTDAVFSMVELEEYSTKLKTQNVWMFKV